MKTISKRILYLIEQQDITLYGLSKRTGIAQSTLSGIINDNATPNTKNRSILSNFFNVDVNWLIYGESKNDVVIGNLLGEEFKINTTGQTKYIELPNDGKVAMIPFIDTNKVARFVSAYNDEVFIQSLPYHPLLSDDFESKDLYAFRMSDNSMETDIEKGAVVIANSIPEELWNKEVLYNNAKYFAVVCVGLFLIRAVSYKEGDDFVILKPTNKAYKTSRVKLSDLELVFQIEEKSIKV